MVSPLPLDEPSGAALLEYVISFLNEEILPEVDGRKKFLLRVAINALTILRREDEQFDVAFELTFSRLRELGVTSEEDLAAAIRTDTDVATSPEVLKFVMDWTRAKLQISNPRYVESTDLTE
jgi:Domain of unknown function (DUF6285)